MFKKFSGVPPTHSGAFLKGGRMPFAIFVQTTTLQAVSGQHLLHPAVLLSKNARDNQMSSTRNPVHQS